MIPSKRREGPGKEHTLGWDQAAPLILGLLENDPENPVREVGSGSLPLQDQITPEPQIVSQKHVYFGGRKDSREEDFP